MSPILTALLAIGSLTTVLASLLVVANRRLHVAEDPRIDVVEDMLPHANCGACGFPGCRPFAEALVTGLALPGKCTVGSPDDHEAIAAFLGVDVGAEEKQVARLACAGGTNVARNRARYHGLSSCAAAALVGGGAKGCPWGCLGLGDCVAVCDFDAIQLDAHALPVISEDRCTACGDCVTACPKDLLSLHPISHRLWVACRSRDAGDEILDDCEVACTACGRCAMDAPDLVTMRNHLPVIDHSRPGARGGMATPDTGPKSATTAGMNAGMKAIGRCPTGAIGWLEPGSLLRKGPAARTIIRQQPRPEAPT